MRIAVIPVGNLETPSTWYRIGQYVPHLADRGIEVDFFPKDIDPDTLEKYDLILNQKNLFSPHKWKHLIRRKRVLFDFDDALWTRPIKPYNWFTQQRVNHRLKFWLQECEAIVANEYLAGYARKVSDRVSVIPMSLDLDVWKPGTREKGLIGWSGAPHNLHYLEKIEPELLRLKSDFPQVAFAVYSGKRPNLKIPFEYVPFKKGEEHLFTQRLDIGLLPLDSDPYSKGKSPIKGLQYMACRVPTVHCHWYDTLADLLSSPDKREAYAEAGRAIVEERHDMRKVVQQLLDCIEGADNLQLTGDHLF